MNHLLHRERVDLWSFGILLACLPLSYYPLLHFGTVSETNIDISLLYIVTCVTVATTIPLLWRRRQNLLHMPIWLLLLSFSAYQYLSLFWTTNLMRGLLTASFSLLMTILVAVTIVQWPKLRRHLRQPQSISFGILVGLSLWCIWQIFGEAFGVSTAWTLLPEMYTAATFGVARPTGFALEPQFLGSLLIAPFLWVSYQLMTSRKQPALQIISLLLITTLLLLTLSRGAILAGLIGLLLLLVFVRPSIRQLSQLLFTGSSALVITLCIIFLAAMLNTRDTISGSQAVSGVISHLSFGRIELSVTQEKPSDVTTPSPSQEASELSTTPRYVESSTNERLSMSTVALSIWKQDISTLLIGVGGGGFGRSAHAYDASLLSNSIVNNTYLELLVELGVIGLALFILVLLVIGYQLFRRRLWLPLAILLAIIVQWNFFSGNANIVHVWVLIGVFASLTIGISRQKVPSSLIQ